jgi:hypothetical protein
MNWAFTGLSSLLALGSLFIFISSFELHALIHSGVYRILLVVLTAALFTNFISFTVVKLIRTYPSWHTYT